MTVQGGFGVALKINTGSLTTIVHMEDVDSWTMQKIIAEVTAHDSTGGYYEAVATGKRRFSPFSCTLVWEDAAATHAQIVTSFNADTTIGMSIQDPDGTEVISFNAHIEMMERFSKQDGAYRCKVTVHPSGQPTIT